MLSLSYLDADSSPTKVFSVKAVDEDTLDVRFLSLMTAAGNDASASPADGTIESLRSSEQFVSAICARGGGLTVPCWCSILLSLESFSCADTNS